LSIAHRDHCVASGILCRSHLSGPDITPDPRHAARFRLHCRLVKSDGFSRTRTPSIDECCLLRFGLRRSPPRAWLAPHSRRGNGITDNLAPGRGVSITKPASGALSPPEHKAGWPGPGEFLSELAARCEWNTWTGRRSSNSATRTIHKHNPRTARSPVRPLDMKHPACAGLGGDLLKGLGPLPSRRPSTPGDTETAPPSQAFRPNLRRTRSMPAEVSRARGRPALTARLLMPLAREQMTELHPDSIRSDTSRHEITATPEGEPGTGRRPTEAEQRNSCDLASQAFPHAQTRGRRPGWPTHGLLSRDRWLTGLLSQPSATGAKGRLTRTSAKKCEIRCTRGAFHQ
jgi:hypothetical protein